MENGERLRLTKSIYPSNLCVGSRIKTAKQYAYERSDCHGREKPSPIDGAHREDGNSAEDCTKPGPSNSR